jgi:hypothetical protein
MRTISLFSLAFPLVLAACGSEDDPMPTAPMDEARFTLRVENISDRSALPTPFAPVAWAVSPANPFFTPGAMAGTTALESLAEDGDPSGLVADVALGGAIDTPVSGTMPGVIHPGEAYEATFSVAPEDGRLTLASMVVQSNDLFIAPADGIPLFGADGPLAERDVTEQVLLWDAGTGRNQAPGAGPDQAPRQMHANTGPAEGVVGLFRDSTRALPPADRIADVTVTEANGTFEISLANVSSTTGALLTPVAPIFWAVHDQTWSLFDEGGTASAGLEELAEDGSPATLVSMYHGAMGVAHVGAQAVTAERPMDAAGPAFPGERYVIEVTPDAQHRYLSLAAMVVQSNDAFLALPASGVALLDESGMLRSAVEVERDISQWLAVWDAGTEANEVPGAGMNQAPRQAGPDTGPADPIATVRRHQDATNDLAEPSALFDVTVVSSSTSGTFDVTVTNTSDQTAFPTPLTPVAWAVHDDGYSLFTMGAEASAELERLAEDGDPAQLADLLSMETAVADSGVHAIPVGATEAGPLMPGASYTFSVTPSSSERFLSFASMVVHSNDTILSTMPGGVALLDEMGDPRSDTEIAADIADALAAFDVGTEGNQVGAIGPDQPLHQSTMNIGPAEGSAMVRTYDDPVWSYPDVSALVRVTVRPAP